MEEAIPYKKLEENENCILLVTPAGGHLGWVSGPGAPFGENVATLVSCQMTTGNLLSSDSN